MWFNNILFYKCVCSKVSALEEQLKAHALKPCSPHSRTSLGWIPVFLDFYTQQQNNCNLFCFGKEERLLPRSVLLQMAAPQIEIFEQENQRKIRRFERNRMLENLEFELLPKAFCLLKQTYALLNFKDSVLFINSSSTNQAENLISLLKKSLPNTNIELIKPEMNLSKLFAQWINNPSKLPSHFELANNCLLISLDDENKQFNCKGYEEDAMEIKQLLSQNLVPAEISLIWREKIQFTLTHNFSIKKLKCKDLLMEDFKEFENLDDEIQQRDANIYLLAGELTSLYLDLLNIFQINNQSELKPVLCA